ncbi:MAG: voltage-gated chloride channel family protein [Proteobacteria bacterium]|nr:MAG: voltage-gated chloride channel family protein [Pseudomonadota bacterium]
MRWFLLPILVGLFAGLSATLFLWLLELATQYRLAHKGLIWLLPLAGLLIGEMYYRYGKDILAGNNLIIEEIHEPKNIVPLIMAPFILAGTLITHLFGGSAGREGTAVQMSASLADQIGRLFNCSHDERKILLTAGAGAGFGAAIGAPIAGIIFGMEVVRTGRLRPFAVVESAIASIIGYSVIKVLHAPHTVYATDLMASYTIESLGSAVVAGFIFGMAAFLFIRFVHLIEHLQSAVKYPPFRPLLAGILLIGLYHLAGFEFAGLGLASIKAAFFEAVSVYFPVIKTTATAITIGSGFKGGEFVPLVFIGTTLGSYLSLWLPISLPTLAASGFAAVFAGASKTPVACTLMAIELFGIRIAPFALLACYASSLASGSRSIYRSQRKGSQ